MPVPETMRTVGQASPLVYMHALVDQNTPRTHFCGVSLGSDMTVSQILLTQHGIPVMNLSDGKAYCFNPSLSTW